MAANLDLVRSIYADWERGDFLTRADWADPDIEFVMADAPSPGPWSGLDGMARGFREFAGAWEGYRITAEEYREVGRGCVLALVTRSGRAKASGIELGALHSLGAHVFHLRDGKVRRLLVYGSRERALADLGLTE